MKLLRASFTAALKMALNVNIYNGMIRGFATAAGKSDSESKKVGEAFQSLKRLCREGRIPEAEQMLEVMKCKGLFLDERTYSSVIGWFCNLNKIDSAHTLLSEMIAKGFSPSVVTYNSLVFAYCRRDSVDKAVGILRAMAERGLSPDVDSYNRVISKFCKMEELEEALEMKEEMVDKGIFPDAATYSSLMEALCVEQRLSEAFDLFREMLRGGVSPDELTYTRLLNACCLVGEFTKAFHLHDEMIHKGFLPDFVTGFSPAIVTYNALIHGLCFLDRVEEALEILRGMPEMGLSPNAVSYSTVISGFCQIGELGKAYELKIETEDKAIWWLDEDTYDSLMDSLSYEDTYSSVMNDYLAEGNMQRALQLDHDMSRDGYLSSYVAYSVLINGLHKKARTREAKRDLLYIASDGFLSMPSYTVYDILLENCSNSEFKSLVELVKDYSMRDLSDDAATAHTTMLHLKNKTDGENKTDGGMYNLLIFEHCRSHNVHKAYNMYMEMVHYGHAPHMFSVLALISALDDDRMYNEMSWVINNTLRSCNLSDSEQLKVLSEINVTKSEIYALLDVLAEMAMDSLLLDGGKCSYAPASRHVHFSAATIIVFLILILRGLQDFFT
ncbi:pentatricopeptide repeat-containing protein At5g39710-like [Lotus japonicus]|uniref:pentatricopeptide repeat-containing protein At5g39710-like n=1 Tax=Lotus japonicus TaxID=34305 RepID=UPI00258BC705|nr:pentatricopeptide repeat-containing protein At5g39710-like [Lotus japonicus]